MTEPELDFSEKRRGDRYYAALESRLGWFISRALLAFALCGLTSAFSLLGFGLVLQNQTQFSEKIQTERFSTLLDECIRHNIQHDLTLVEARVVLPAQMQPTVVLLVDGLQPYVDNCEEYAANRVKKGRP